MRRVTQSQVAQAVGVHAATVSLALRGDPRIPGKTADRVRQAAERMGYRPDPALAAVAASRWRGGDRCPGVTLAFISQLRRPHAGSHGLFDGVKARANELGYGLDRFFLDDYPDSAALQRILVARGIRGLIVGPFFEPVPQLALDWRKFCLVGCGHGHFEPRFHAVTYDPYESVMIAWRRAIDYGYRRPGLAVMLHSPPVIVEDDESRRAAALICHEQGAPGGRVPPFFYTAGESYDLLAPRAVAWYRKWKPDAVIGFNAMLTHILQHELKVRAPGQIGFAQFDCLFPEEHRIAGIRDLVEDIGRGAVDLLQQTIHANQWGLPEARIRHCLDPKWVDGDTLPRRP
jgi:LacI family transcriptional regulator